MVVRAENGKIVDSQIIDGEIIDVVKKVAAKAIEEWDPEFSDYIVMKDKYEVSLKLPLTKEQFERFRKFGLRRTSDGYATFDIPVYVISFENQWVENDYVDRKIYLVSIYVDDNIKKELEDWAASSTSEEAQRRALGSFELEPEDLEELEE